MFSDGLEATVSVIPKLDSYLWM